MSQVVIYKGVRVEARDRQGGNILVRCKNMGDAQKAGIPFKAMEGMTALFEAWVPEAELIAVE